MTQALDAFAGVGFDAHGDAWADPPDHVDALHGSLADRIVAEFFVRTRARSPAIGQVLTGPAGSGATHLIGALRRRVWEDGGWFVRVDAFGARDFWGAAALDLADSLSRRIKGGATQASAVLMAAAKKLSADPAIRAAVESASKSRTTRMGPIDMLVEVIAAAAPAEADARRDPIRALALRESREPVVSAAAAGWLQGEHGQSQRALGFQAPAPPSEEIVRRLLGILSSAGPTLIAVEGIDAASAESQVLVEGLMALQALGARTLTLVSCPDATWPRLKGRAATAGRFRELQPLPPVGHADLVGRLIAARLAPAYAQAGFAPPYPSYPFTRAALDSGVGLTARQILLRCRRHQADSIAAGEIEDCRSLGEVARPPPAVWRDNAEIERWDQRYARRLAAAKPPPPEDEAALAALLAEACALYAAQLDPSDAFDVEGGAGSPAPRPPLHARLAFILRDPAPRQMRWGFSLLGETDPVAFEARLSAASLAAAGGRLVVLRAPPPPEGAADAVARFQAAGGQFAAPDPGDFAVFAALRDLKADGIPTTWLRQRKPLSGVKLFEAAGLAAPDFLAAPTVEPKPAPPPVPAATAESPPQETRAGGGVETPRPSPAPAAAAAPEAPRPPPPEPKAGAAPRAPAKPAPPPSREIVFGRAAEPGVIVGPASLPPDKIKDGVALFAGLGRGGLLVRIVEEAALAGVPTLALDSSGELARLGEPWPSRPTEFSDDDARKARLYFERVEVALWTPGLAEGRPFALNLFPDFAALERRRDAVEAREQAVEMALATLEPYLGGGGAKAIKQRGALADSLRLFGRRGGGALEHFVELLGDLPETASRTPEAPALAREIAEQLLAACAMDPTLAASGEPLDLGELFEGSAGRTRVSVVSLAGLAQEARVAFVNRLQMALVSWMRDHPGPRLYAIDEAQTFSPAREHPATRRSALALAREGPTFGLGLVVAAPDPQALDPALASACRTHVYGRVETARAQEAVRAMMAARGGQEPGELKPGEVYFAAEGLARPVKLRTGPTLSRRAQNLPTTAEIAAMAQLRNSAK